MISMIRELRHGKFKKLSPLWLFMENIVRKLILIFQLDLYTKHMIGKYRLFRLHIYFMFSNFKDWGVRT